MQWRVTLLLFVCWASALAALYSTLNMNLGKTASWLKSYDTFVITILVTVFGSLGLTMTSILCFAWQQVLFR